MSTPDEVLAEHDRLLRALGSVVVAFQQIELWVAEALAGLLEMKVLEERYLVLSAMSFAQKVDLLCDLFPRKRTHARGVEIKVARAALYLAEQYRNRIVHSVWAVDGALEWQRSKGTLKGNSGFRMGSESVKAETLERAVVALRKIRDWEVSEAAELSEAMKVLEERDGNAA